MWLCGPDTIPLTVPSVLGWRPQVSLSVLTSLLSYCLPTEGVFPWFVSYELLVMILILQFQTRHTSHYFSWQYVGVSIIPKVSHQVRILASWATFGLIIGQTKSDALLVFGRNIDFIEEVKTVCAFRMVLSARILSCDWSSPNGLFAKTPPLFQKHVKVFSTATFQICSKRVAVNLNDIAERHDSRIIYIHRRVESISSQ